MKNLNNFYQRFFNDRQRYFNENPDVSVDDVLVFEKELKKIPDVTNELITIEGRSVPLVVFASLHPHFLEKYIEAGGEFPKSLFKNQKNLKEFFMEECEHWLRVHHQLGLKLYMANIGKALPSNAIGVSITIQTQTGSLKSLVGGSSYDLSIIDERDRLNNIKMTMLIEMMLKQSPQKTNLILSGLLASLLPKKLSIDDISLGPLFLVLDPVAKKNILNPLMVLSFLEKNSSLENQSKNHGPFFSSLRHHAENQLLSTAVKKSHVAKKKKKAVKKM